MLVVRDGRGGEELAAREEELCGGAWVELGGSGVCGRCGAGEEIGGGERLGVGERSSGGREGDD